MLFHELAKELKPHLDPNASGSDYVVTLVGDMLRDPMDEDEQQRDVDGRFNPMSALSTNMRNQILSGTKHISKKRAGEICSLYDGVDFADMIDNLFEGDKEHLQIFLAGRGFDVSIDELGSAFQDIFRQVFHGLEKGIHDVDVRLTIHEPKPSIRNLAADRVYCEDGRLFIDGAVIELPIKFSDDEIYDFETGYISALCNAYAEVLSRDVVTTDDIPDLPRKYQRNFYDQRKSYLIAEGVQRSIREVYEDGENQFDVLKEDTYAGISMTYLDDYANGYQRLLSVLKKVTDIQLTKSKLMLIKNLIGNLERLGIVHILVNDGVVRSWVDPYEE